MNKHFELIDKYCRVLAVVENRAILFVDGDEMVAEINGAMFSCSSIDEFNDMVELFGDDSFDE